MLNADDSLDVFGVHGVGGIVGSLMTGLLSSHTISGVRASVGNQLIGVVAVLVYSGLMTGLLLWITKVLVGLRVAEDDEVTGLDLSQHREQIAQ
jgi:Amt family ammonium transporter